MNSVTDELRRMLDKRGVEYDVDDTQVDGNGTMYRVTYVKEGYGRTWVYEEPPECGLLVSYDHDLGAEDAITATLGAGECTLESAHGYWDPYVRTAYQIELSCHTLDAWDDPVPPSYCPYCGKRVVKEDA